MSSIWMRNSLQSTELNLFCICIVIGMGLVARKSLIKEKGGISRLITSIGVVYCISFFSDALWAFLDSNLGFKDKPVLFYLINSTYFLAGVAGAYLIFIYSQKKLDIHFAAGRWIQAIFAIPALVTYALAFSQPLNKLLFFMGENGAYVRGPGFVIYFYTLLFYYGIVFFSGLYYALEGEGNRRNLGIIFAVYGAVVAVAASVQNAASITTLPVGCTLGIIAYTLQQMVLLERAKEKRLQRFNQIMSSLEREYTCICYVDLENDRMEIYSQQADNGTMIDMTAYKSFSEGMEAYLENCVYEEDRKNMRELLKPENMVGILKEQRFIAMRYRIFKGEKTFYREMRFWATEKEGPVTSGILGFSNIDELIRMEHEKIIMQQEIAHIAELEHLNAQINEARNRAEKANEAKTAFLFNMSHDIRTPMNAIIGFTGMAQKHMDDREKMKDYLAKIKLSGDYLLELINDVLDMSRIESGHVVIADAGVNIEERGRNILVLCRDSAEKKGVALAYEQGELQNQDVMADALHIDQILMNIMGNAIKYTEAGGTVTLRIRQTGGPSGGFATYAMEVEDTGIGMSEEFVKHIFEPFSRENSEKVAKIQGSGLGMSIVKQLVHRMDGKIDVESKVGVGTKVTVTLKLKVLEESEKTLAALEERKEVILRGQKVLLVEDNAMNRDLAYEILSDEGMEVDVAEDGDVAVEKIKAGGPGRYGFVLMDVQMPRMNGYAATKEIRKLSDPDLADIPIIAMTANAFAEDREEALAAGMNAHVSKPIVIPTLLRTLAEIVDEREKI